MAGQDVGDFSAWVYTIIAIGIGCGVAGIAFSQVIKQHTWGMVVVMFVLALGFRLSLLPAQRYISDDAYRYRWDGKVMGAGINPYQYAPSDPKLKHLHTDELDDRINHPQYHTVYPPLAQLYFTLAYQLSPSNLHGLQALFLLSELVTWLLLLVELNRLRMPLSNVLIAAWSPLLILEGYLPGHLDILALPWVAFFLISLGRKQPLPAAAMLALSCLIKPIFLVFIPAAVWHFGLKRSLWPGLLFVGILTVAYLPFASAGWSLFSSMWIMAEHWSFNGSLAALVETVLPPLSTRIIMACMLSVLVLMSAVREGDILAKLSMAIAAFVICSTTVFPWYLICLVPVLVLRPDPALLALVILAPITEIMAIDYHLFGNWKLPLWVQLVEYLPFYCLLFLGYRKRWGMFRTNSLSFAVTT